MLGPIAAFAVALVLGMALSRLSRRSLAWLVSREKKVGKERIHRLFPKRKRPLGGGLALLLAATVAAVMFPSVIGSSPTHAALWTLGLAWAYGLIGLSDDLKKTRGLGMRDKPKLALQTAVALVYGFVLWRYAGLDAVLLPFGGEVYLGACYIIFAALVIAATTNAVNLGDGIDGLAGGASVVVLLGFSLIGVVYPDHAAGPVIWPLLGAVLGFLSQNLPPARLLMGDTGALGLGAAVASLALFSRTELWLPLLAAPFTIDALSVIIQMGTVRGLWKLVRPLRHQTTETARPFLCTPIHHHFQWLGWRDWKVLALFWGFGGALAGWTVLALASGWAWLAGILALGLFLAVAAGQKRLRASYFLGLGGEVGQPSTVVLYRGLPVVILRWPLYEEQRRTEITEGMLVGATAESMLWRPLSEVEAHVVLGKIYADHKLLDQALSEWEQVPVRNLLLRPSVVVRLARIYYGRDRLLEAIKLWEQLPGARLDAMPNAREVVRNARLRLADLAGKSYRQSMRLMRAVVETGEVSDQIETYLLTARRFNQDLLALLLYERDKLRGRAPDPEAAHQRRDLLRRTRNVVMARLRDLDAALAYLARMTPGPPEAAERGEDDDPAQRAAGELQISKDGLLRLLAGAGTGWPTITRASLHPKDSRNLVRRLSLTWQGEGPPSVVIKRYTPERVAFFSASYRRERGILRLLHGYGVAVPRVYAGEATREQALLVMQDLGDETLAERLESSDARTKQLWLQTAVKAIVDLQAATQEHIQELIAEVHKVDKERLSADYYLRAMHIALERITAASGARLPEAEWKWIAEQARPFVDSLAALPGEFIHFELTPHHFLISEGGLHIFDFEQGTIGPVEFDLAALLLQPESDLGAEARADLLQHYLEAAAEAGLPARPGFEQAFASCALFKCLVYAGAAVNFRDRFGGEHHVQRLRYYLDQCAAMLVQWPDLRPLDRLIGPRLRAAEGRGG